MRYLQRLATAAALVLILLLPATAATADNLGLSGGGSSGGSIYAFAGRFGGESKGGRTCTWSRVWPSYAGPTQLVAIQNMDPSVWFEPLFGALLESMETEAIRTLTPQQAEQRLAEAEALGEEAPEILQTVPGITGEDAYGTLEILDGYDGFTGVFERQSCG